MEWRISLVWYTINTTTSCFLLCYISNANCNICKKNQTVVWTARSFEYKEQKLKHAQTKKYASSVRTHYTGTSRATILVAIRARIVRPWEDSWNTAIASSAARSKNSTAVCTTTHPYEGGAIGEEQHPPVFFFDVVSPLQTENFRLQTENFWLQTWKELDERVRQIRSRLDLQETMQS